MVVAENARKWAKATENGFWGLGRLENAMWGSAMALVGSELTQNNSILNLDDTEHRKQAQKGRNSREQ